MTDSISGAEFGTAWDNLVVIPDDGDPRTAASVNQAFNNLARRTYWLRYGQTEDLVERGAVLPSVDCVSVSDTVYSSLSLCTMDVDVGDILDFSGVVGLQFESDKTTNPGVDIYFGVDLNGSVDHYTFGRSFIHNPALTTPGATPEFGRFAVPFHWVESVRSSHDGTYEMNLNLRTFTDGETVSGSLSGGHYQITRPV